MPTADPDANQLRRQIAMEMQAETDKNTTTRPYAAATFSSPLHRVRQKNQMGILPFWLLPQHPGSPARREARRCFYLLFTLRVEHLAFHELGEQAAFRQQLVVGALLGYAPAVDHEDSVAMADGR